jgi:mono/diheme cytochrome c family protein
MSMKEKNIIAQFFEDPGRIFGLLYPYIFILLLVIGLYYLNVINFVGKQKVPVREGIVIKAWEDIPVADARVTSPVDIESVLVPSQSLLAKGRELYTTNCASCHGDAGRGDGIAGAGLNPPPKDFSDAANWKNNAKISGIYTSLYEGIPGTGMAMYSYLPPEDLFALSHYVRTFVSDPPSDTRDDIEELDFNYSLSEGVELPPQIPVLKAKEIIASETTQEMKKLQEVISTMDRDAHLPAVALFQQITMDRDRAIAALMQHENWKRSESSFVEFISSNLVTNGFSTRSVALSSEEWSVLYLYLRTII